MERISRHYDVVICGGGLAGLGLARQLSLNLPGLRVLVLEKQARPLAESAHKVGESTLEGSGRWFCHNLELEQNIQQRHLRKFGLRFFTGGSVEPFEDRLELGASTFSTIPSYQLARGRLENDLRRLVAEGGVELIEECTVSQIEIAEEGTHQVRFREASGALRKVEARWAIDALGRRRLLQRQLGLAKASGHRASACWWRVEGEVDLDRIVPGTSTAWHRRVEERRWLSTNHLMGAGYWVWVIPLSPGATSIGIVTAEDQHPIKQRSRYPRALQWLETHEPCLHRLLGNAPPLDFHALKHFAHQATQVFSARRWCTIGEAGVFTDPLYSHGSELIAAACNVTVQLIKRDLASELKAELADLYNQVYLETVECMTTLFRDMYPAFVHQKVMLYKLLWDSAYYWAFVAPLVFKRLMERPAVLPGYLDLMRRFGRLNRRFQQLCRQWAAEGDGGRLKAGRYGFRRCPWVNDVRLRLLRQESDEEFLAALQETLGRFEEMVRLVQLRKPLESPGGGRPVSGAGDLRTQLQQYAVPVSR